MANFRCPECDICFAASHQCDGHRQSVHQSTYKIHTAIGRITVNRSTNGKYPCPVDYYRSTFERNDKLQGHFKVQHAEQSNSALNQDLDDNAQKAMSLGMLIEPPIEQTPELLCDVSLAVFDIADGIRLLLCRVCNLCLEPEARRAHNHLLGHNNWRAPKRRHNDGPHCVTGIPPVTDFASSLDEIEFTQLQNPRLERYTTSPQQELLPVVPRIRVVNEYQCEADGCAYYSATKKIMGNHRRANHSFLPIHASGQPCQVEHLFRKVGYIAYFGVDHQNMELEGNPTGLHLKEQVHVLLQAHQCSMGNVAPNPSIRELSPWLRVSRWHELAVNRIIPAGTPLDRIKRTNVLPNLIGEESNLDRSASMVIAYLETT
jgi:hypothetical protein